MDSQTPSERVAAVVALKNLPEAKSRLAPLHPAVRARLARVMALDTLAVLAAVVDEVVVVSDQPDLAAALDRRRIRARVIAEPTRPKDSPTDALNSALARGAEAAGTSTVLACVGDLPALRARSVTRVLSASLRHPRSFVPDHDDHGTTMLIARRSSLDPRYGTEIGHAGVGGSAGRHTRSGAVPLTLGELPDARWDVDTLADLAVAVRLGVGPATSTMIDSGSGVLGDYLSATVLHRDDRSLVLDTEKGTELLSLAAYDGDPALAEPGRRLHAVRVAGALRGWL